MRGWGRGWLYLLIFRQKIIRSGVDAIRGKINNCIDHNNLNEIIFYKLTSFLPYLKYIEDQRVRYIYIRV